MITVAAVRRYRAGKGRREIADGRGLYLVVQPSGAKSWCMRFRRKADGRHAKLTLGTCDESGSELRGEPALTSPFGDEDGLILSVAGRPIPLDSHSVAADVPFQDPVELDFHDEEGRQRLREHLYRERSSRLVRQFKQNLIDFACRVCGFDFVKVYGELGREFIEAHHTKQVSQLEPNETVRLQDLVAVCSNCHRMLHRKYPTIEWQSLKNLIGRTYADRH